MANGLHLDHPDVTEISTKAAVTLPDWAVFSATSSEVVSAIKNGYFHGEASYYCVTSCLNSAECHRSSVPALLQTQAHSLLVQARQDEEVCIKVHPLPSSHVSTTLVVIKSPSILFLC